MAERISIEHLGKVYPGGNRALDDVSIEVEPGTFLVLLGPSGSGKTTLLRCLAGIERISSGTIRIGEKVVAEGSRHLPPEQRDLSMVFQDYALWPHLVARDNVAFALRRRQMDRAASRRGADTMLTRVGLASLADRYPNELSGGEQQRVALARALVADTGLVLCDEPLSNLDADLRDRLRVEISALVRDAGATTIYITHDQSEAFALADRIGVLDHGRLVQLDVPESIYLWPTTPFVARFTGLAGEIPVKVTGRDSASGAVLVSQLGAGGNREFYARPAEGQHSEADGVVMVRPSAVSLCDADDAERHLVGMVTDVAFRGRGYEHVVDLPDGTRVVGVLAESRSERSRNVGLRLDPAGCLFFGIDALTMGEGERERQ